MLVKNLTVYIEVNHFLSNGFLLIDTFFLIPSMVGGKFICILEILFIEITVEPVLFLKFKLCLILAIVTAEVLIQQITVRVLVSWVILRIKKTSRAIRTIQDILIVNPIAIIVFKISSKSSKSSLSQLISDP